MRRNWCRQAFIFTGTDDPNVASFDVVLGKGGSGGGNALEHVHPLAQERFLVTNPTETWAAQDFRSAKALFVPSLKRDIVPSIAWA